MLAIFTSIGGFFRGQWDVVLLGGVLAGILAVFVHLLSPSPVYELVLETPVEALVSETTRAVRMETAARPASSRRARVQTIHLNTATAGELELLPGVGPVLARRIMAYRERAGGFESPEDILAVSGIGPKTYAKMQPYLKL